jgi:hypothetical protein
MERQMWLVYAIAAGLCWGTYVPLVQQGIRGLGMNAFGSFLCVGLAYFLIAVLLPLGLFAFGERTPQWNMYGISFATLAGTAGALGALFVIFANRATPPGSDYRMFIGPVIFALAPLLNTVISMVWHPSPATGVFHFGLEALPGWKFFLGILLTGAGAALVLYSKEEMEHNKPKAARPGWPGVVASAPENPK